MGEPSPSRRPLRGGAEVSAGVELKLVFIGNFKADGNHIAFAASSGELVGSSACGDFGARVVTTVRNGAFMWSARWIPDTLGSVVLAAAHAHVGMGTPSVQIQTLRLEVVENATRSHTGSSTAGC